MIGGKFNETLSRSKSSTSQKTRIFVLKSFLEVYILAATYQKAFIIGPSGVKGHFWVC